MADKPWKRAERRTAKALGGTRVTRKGAADPDVDHAMYAIEAKYRKTLPKFLTGAIDQAKKNGKPGQLPIAILIEHHKPIQNALVVMRLHDFSSWAGQGGNEIMEKHDGDGGGATPA